MELFSRVTRFDGADEEPEAPWAPAFLLWDPARRRVEAASADWGSAEAAGPAGRVPASRRFSSIPEGKRSSISAEGEAAPLETNPQRAKGSSPPASERELVDDATATSIFAFRVGGGFH